MARKSLKSPKKLRLGASDSRVTTVSLVVHLAKLEDPRLERTKLHLLEDVLVLSICAIISGADGWVNVEEWAIAKETWLRTFLRLPNGIPSHDTIGRLFSALDPVAFEKCFVAWTHSVAVAIKGHVAIDGKTLRRSFDAASERSAIHMVSAWARESQLVLGQVKTDDKSNEITAIPRLLQMLELAGCVVTIDAMGCQKDIAEAIIEKNADYVLSLKENQPNTHAVVVQIFADAEVNDSNGAQFASTETHEAHHGRAETRRYLCIAVPKDNHTLKAWAKLQSLVMVDRIREMEGTTTTERSYYLSSLPPSVKRNADAIRSHWGIENSLHWCLDVQFHEDDCRVRKDHAPQNFAILRHIALNLVKQEKTAKLGIQSKRLKAGWDLSYLLKIIGN